MTSTHLDLGALAVDTRQNKERAVARGGAGADLTPSLVVGSAHGVSTVGLRGRDLSDQVRKAIASFSADHVVVICETYVAVRGSAGTPRTESTLAERFAAGEAGVWEAVDLISLPRWGEAEVWILPYRYETGEVAWAQPLRRRVQDLPPAAQLLGPSADGFADLGTPDWWSAALRLSADGMWVRGPSGELVGAGATFAADEACPCGGGATYSHCHGTARR